MRKRVQLLSPQAMHGIRVFGPDGKEAESFSDFRRRFLEICKKHRDEGRALAFAFILYDITHPAVVKMLEDEDYWRSLDKIAGKHLSVFSFDFRKPRKRRRTRMGGDFMEMMISVPADHEDGPHAFIEKTFGVNVPERGPAVLFFQVREGKVLDSVLVTFAKNKTEDVYNAVDELLRIVTQSVSKVAPEYQGNDVEIWNLIASELDNEKFWKRVKMAGRVFPYVDLISGLVPKEH